MRFTLQASRLGLRNSVTRIPFRYGAACLTRCPQATLEVTLETDAGPSQGYASDCLPPGWFDKRPGRTFRRQIDDMLTVIRGAREVFQEEASRPVAVFDAWLAAYPRVMAEAARLEFPPLLGSFGLSFLERACIDAVARAAGQSFAQAAHSNLLGIRAGAVHAELRGLAPGDWLPPRPRTSLYVRHTVGLGDALLGEDIPSADRAADGLPQAVDEYIDRCGVRYFKLKLANNLELDLRRLIQFASLAEQRLGDTYRLTLDGNEQYKHADEFDALIDAIDAEPRLQTLWKNTLAVEQPLERSIALDARHTAGVRELSRRTPVIIDESDGALSSFAEALELGYRGVSSKNCKGPIKSLLNAGLVWLRNDRGRRSDYLMTGEDLCTVGVVGVQADLCLVATLGLEHVERNGHHYHRGLGYLPEAQQRAALAAHGDLYGEESGVIGVRVRDGQVAIGSLQCEGFGFDVTPDFESMESPETWSFGSLGLESD